MKTINLIPMPRIETRRRRVWRNRCIAGCAAYGVLAVAASVACHAVWGESDPRVAQQLTETAGEVEQTGKTIAAVRTELDGAQAMLKASRSITEQPDWSALMALLAAKAGPDIALRGCVVRPRDPDRPAAAAPDPKKPGAKPAAPPPAPAEPVMLLSLAGLGKSPPAVSQFVLRLEGTGLFARVSLVETNRESFEKGVAIAFRLECSLEAPAVVGAATSGTTAAGKTDGRDVQAIRPASTRPGISRPAMPSPRPTAPSSARVLRPPADPAASMLPGGRAKAAGATGGSKP